MLKPKKKFTKRELKEDKFVTATFKTQAYLQENWQMVLGAAVSIVVVLLLVVWVINYYYEEKSEAATMVTSAELLMQEGKRGEALEKLKIVIEDYDNDQAGYAAFLLGTSLMQEGLMDSAGYYFNKTVEYTDDPLFTAPAFMNLGSIAYHNGDYATAEEYFMKAYNKSDIPEFKAEALLNAAVAMKNNGKKEDARNTLEKLLDEYSDTKFAKQAEIQLAML